MFLENSRYAKVAVEQTATRDGRLVSALRLRALNPVSGDPYSVLERDRLDLLAQSRYADGTKFWHIADANTELDARVLTADAGSNLNLPRSG